MTIGQLPRYPACADRSSSEAPTRIVGQLRPLSQAGIRAYRALISFSCSSCISWLPMELLSTKHIKHTKRRIMT